jgi:glycosyltransferase involved in cell wall biosynthesis
VVTTANRNTIVMRSLPTISVVVPAYNGAAFLAEALDSVFTQTLRPAEIVVVDDASTDATPELVKSLVRTAPVPIRLIQLEHNTGGPAQPLNVGVTAATGQFIAVLDQDDVFAPDKLEVQAQVLAGDSELVAVFALCAPLNNRTEPLQSQAVLQALDEHGTGTEAPRRVTSRQLIRLLLRHGNFIIGYPGFLFRRADWVRKGGADGQLRIGSDYDFLCWLALQGPAALVPRVLYYRREHDANLCKRSPEVYLETMRVKARYVARERWLLDDKELSRGLRDELFSLGYWVRESGRPWEAFRYHLLARRLWGWDRRTLLAMAKLLPHALCGRFARSLARTRR